MEKSEVDDGIRFLIGYALRCAETSMNVFGSLSD